MADALRFAVIGLGRFGQQLATALAADGAEVIAIDRSGGLIDGIRDDVTLALRMDATDEDAIHAQEIEDVDAAIVGIGHDFEAAALCVAVLKGLGCRRVIARAESEMQSQLLTRIGADSVVFPERESALRLAHQLLMPNLQRYVELGEGHGLIYTRAPSAFHNKTLEQSQFRAQYNVNVVAIQRTPPVETDSERPERRRMAIAVPRPDTVILPDDILILVGSDESLSQLPRD